MATNMEQLPAEEYIEHLKLIEEQIEQRIGDLINLLITRKEHLLQIVQRIREKYCGSEDTRSQDLEELEQAHLRFREITLDRGINVSVREDCDIMLEKEKKQKATPTKLPAVSLHCPSLPLLQSKISEFGDVVERPDHSNKLKPMLTFGKKGKGRMELEGCGLALDEHNQKIYIADRENSRVQVFSFEGKFVSQFMKEVLKKPWGIAVTENYIFVTDHEQHKLLQFSKLSHELINTCGGRGRKEGQLLDPRGLSADWNGELFIADSGNNRVSVFSKQLRFQYCVGKESLYFPCDVQMTPDKIVVLDCGEICIHFFSRSGDPITSCVTCGEGEGCLVDKPVFFCVDAGDNLIISDFGQHSIKILSNSGELLHSIGKEGSSKGEFEEPYGIAATESGILFVLSHNSNHCIQLF